MRFHQGHRRSRPRLTKFRWKMFVAINKSHLSFEEQETERKKLREQGTLYRLPQSIRPRTDPNAR